MNLTLDNLTIEDTGPPKLPPTLFTNFPELIDNTAREQFSLCPRKFELSTVNKLTYQHTSVHLHAGGAYAAGLEAMRKAYYDDGQTQEDAIAAGVEASLKYYGDFQPPEDSNKTAEAIAGAIVHYADHYPFATDAVSPYRRQDGKHAIEFTFAAPLPIKHPQTGNPIVYGGRFDMLAVFRDSLFVLDDKTTTQLGPSWGNQWELNSQFTGYVWAAKSFDYPVAGAIIRGQAILKDSFKNAQAVVYRPDWQIERWYKQLCRDVTRAVQMWEEKQEGKRDTFDFGINSTCSAYSGCEFRHICLSRNFEGTVNAHYVNRHWNPLAKNPEELI